MQLASSSSGLAVAGRPAAPRRPQASCSPSTSSRVLRPCVVHRALSCSASLHQRRQQQQQHAGSMQPIRRVTTSSQPDTEEARSPLDAPQEWEAPAPSKRPDIFPEFEKMERVFLPKPLPGDPEMPDEEEEEAAKRTDPGDPDPEAPPGEPSEPEQEPGQDPERGTDIPAIPE